MVRDRSGIEQRNLFEWRFGLEDLDLADVLEGYPNFIALRGDSNVGAERTGLGHALDNLMGCRVDHGQLGSEARADEAVAGVGTKNRHSRTVGQPNTPY